MSKKILNKLLLYLILFNFQCFCFVIEFNLMKIPKSIIYQDNDENFDNDFYFVYNNLQNSGESNEIIYQTGDLLNNNQLTSFSFGSYDLYLNMFSSSDCLSNQINSFLFCKDSLFQYFYGSLDMIKTINSLYEQNKISKKIFSHKLDNEDKLRVFFGEEGPIDKSNLIKCELNENNNCLLRNIYIVNNSEQSKNNNTNIENIQVGSYAQINFGYSGIKGTYKEGKKLFDYILSLKTFGEKCYMTTSKSLIIEDEYIKLICNWDTNINNLPKIIFSFGNNDQLQLLLTPEFFFYKQYDISSENYIYISRIEFSKINKFWIIGKPLINNIDLIFDLDDKYLTFAFNEQNNLSQLHLNQNNKTSLKILIIKIFKIICIIIIILFISFLFCYCIRKRRTLKSKEFMVSQIQKLTEMN